MSAQHRLWIPTFEVVLRRFLPKLEADVPLFPETLLAEYGLNSLRTVELLVALESELDLFFPDELLLPETFATASSLWSALENLLAATS